MAGMMDSAKVLRDQELSGFGYKGTILALYEGAVLETTEMNYEKGPVHLSFDSVLRVADSNG